MKRVLLLAVALACGMAGAAGERATAKEAEAMVKKAITHVKADRDAAFREISNPKGSYVDRDLYIVVYKLDGTNVAHGFNQKFIGRNMIEIRDADGREYMRERMEWAKTKQNFWQDLKFTDPLTKKMEPKQTYCERSGELLFCGGVYKI